MSAALLQGVPTSTLDTDLWLDLGERQHRRAMNIATGLGGEMIRQTVAAFPDGALVNFCFRLDGVRSFAEEYEEARELSWGGITIKVLPLERIICSKEFVGRDKDHAQLPLLRNFVASQQRERENQGLDSGTF